MAKNKKTAPIKVDTLGKRILRRLEELGMTAQGASIKAGAGEDLIRNILRKELQGTTHVPRADKLRALALVLSTTPEWLLTGQGVEDIDDITDAHIDSAAIGFQEDTPQGVPLLGFVSAGAQAVFLPLPSGELDRVRQPKNATASTVALEIRGESLGPLFDRWLVYYDDVRSPVTPDLIGKLCVVGLPDERVLVKLIKSTRGGRFNLISNNEADLKDVEINWAALVKHMEPR